MIVKPHQLRPAATDESLLYQALVFGVREYVRKNRFRDVLIGLSGGIDSALTLAIAVDALGAEHVHAVVMPSRYSSALSLTLADKQATLLKVKQSILSIESTFVEAKSTLAPLLEMKTASLTEQNLQARCRAVMLMALSNEMGSLVLTTSNKSEVAVGYSTLYGDMAGGFAVLKDVYKTNVYALARYRNSLSPAIPQEILDRAPSAELAPHQKDEDTLPPYAELDAILARFIEDGQSAETIIAAGFQKEIVHSVIALIRKSEYKRQQSPIGIKVTTNAFGRDWRYPVTNRF